MLSNKKISKEHPILILLAGGKSSRMGIPKGLLKYDNLYWMEVQLNKAISSCFKELIIILGKDKLQYFEKIPLLKKAEKQSQNFKGIKIRVLINDQPQYGALSSIIIALKTIKSGRDVIILPIDVPLIDKREIDKLNNSDHLITIPKYKNIKGHPVGLKHPFWKTLINLNPNHEDFRLDYQIRKIKSSKIELVEVNDKNAILNLNSLKNWNDFLKQKNRLP